MCINSYHVTLQVAAYAVCAANMDQYVLFKNSSRTSEKGDDATAGGNILRWEELVEYNFASGMIKQAKSFFVTIVFCKPKKEQISRMSPSMTHY